jgi:hypothetical protein
LVDRLSFDAVTDLLRVVRDPGGAEKRLTELLQASHDAKQQIDELHAQRAALADAQRAWEQRMKNETAEQESRLRAAQEKFEAECAQRMAKVVEREKAADVLLEKAQTDAKRAETARATAEEKLEKLYAIWR